MTLLGKKIIDIRAMTDEELDQEGWDKHEKTVCLTLEDGTIIIPSIDFEGNGPGKFFLMKDNQTFTIK